MYAYTGYETVYSNHAIRYKVNKLINLGTCLYNGVKLLQYIQVIKLFNTG